MIPCSSSSGGGSLYTRDERRMIASCMQREESPLGFRRRAEAFGLRRGISLFRALPNFFFLPPRRFLRLSSFIFRSSLPFRYLGSIFWSSIFFEASLSFGCLYRRVCHNEQTRPPPPPINGHSHASAPHSQDNPPPWHPSLAGHRKTRPAHRVDRRHPSLAHRLYLTRWQAAKRQLARSRYQGAYVGV